MKSNRIKETEGSQTRSKGAMSPPSRSTKTGANEPGWGDGGTVNIQAGCEHGCRYCYAYDFARRFRGCTRDQWAEPVINMAKVNSRYHKCRGRIMFPSSHDITPANIKECRLVLEKLLSVGNEVLIVSKPHIECIRHLCEHLREFRGRVEFRFSIGSDRDWILKTWEPGAPEYSERLACLSLAYARRYKTSVSCEPMLDAPERILMLYKSVVRYCTESFWIGKLNKLKPRVDTEAMGKGLLGQTCLDMVRQTQTDEAVRALYERMKDLPLVRWKDSIREVVGEDEKSRSGVVKK